MSIDNRQLFIDGKWVDATNGATFDVGNPSTGSTFASVADASRDDAKSAIQAAHAAQPAWAAMNHAERARILHRAGDILESRAKEIQDVLIDEGGSWVGKSMFETRQTNNRFRTCSCRPRIRLRRSGRPGFL